jgi:hydroxyacylglutathione hydrolase
MVRALLLSSSLLMVACGPEVRTFERDDGIAIHHIKLGIPNTYIIDAPGGIAMIDIGEKDDAQNILRGLEQLRIDPAAIDVVVITHGHHDHAGAGAELQEALDAPIALQEDDLFFVEAGFSDPPPSVVIEGELVRPTLDKNFPPFTPDILFGAELDLEPFGVPARVVHVPGHSPGSAAIVSRTGDLFVGDMVRGTAGGSNADEPYEGSPATQVFSADFDADRDNLETLLATGATRVFPGHGEWFDAEALRGWIEDHEDGP